jgi:hypothetical protein
MDMDTVLLVVTFASVSVALVMGVVAWRAAHEARMRSAARVAALRAAAGHDSALREPRLHEELPLRVERTTDTHDVGLFADAAAPDGAGRQRGLAWAAGALIAVLAVGGVAMYPGGGAPAVTGARTAPLELLVLSHERAGNTVNVSGLVRNPPGGSMVERLTAVVFLFDGDGGLLASARAPVDFLRLGPGDDTPFVIALSAPPSAVRYRVSFRTDTGLVPHVDRRAPAAATAAADASPVTR